MRFNTISNYDPSEHPGKWNDEASMAIPDQSYSIQEILERFTSGTMPPLAEVGGYEEYPDIDNPDPMDAPDFDLVDAMELQQAYRTRADARRAAASKSKEASASASTDVDKHPEESESQDNK